MMGFHTTLGTAADAGCTTSHGPMVRQLPLLQHGAVRGLAHTTSIRGEPRARHLGSEQGISHPPYGGAVPDVPCLDGQVRTVPPITDGSGIRRRLPRSGPGYCVEGNRRFPDHRKAPLSESPSTASVLAAVDYVMQYDTMLSNSFAPAGKPALPVPAVAQYRVGFLPVLRNLRFLRGERDTSRLVNVPKTRSVLVCERIAERFVNAMNREGLRPSGSRVLPNDSVASETQRADGASAVDGGVSPSEER